MVLLHGNGHAHLVEIAVRITSHAGKSCTFRCKDCGRSRDRGPHTPRFAARCPGSRKGGRAFLTLVAFHDLIHPGGSDASTNAVAMRCPPASAHHRAKSVPEGVVKLEKGQRIVVSLNASHVCGIGVARKTAATTNVTSGSGTGIVESSDHSNNTDAEVQKMVTFRIAKEEFAFHMRHVREIFRVQTPNQVPDVPEYVLGVPTVRGQILPVIDLRRLLQQRSLADELADSCRLLREEYESWIDQLEKLFVGRSKTKLDATITEQLPKQLAETNSSSKRRRIWRSDFVDSRNRPSRQDHQSTQGRPAH